MKKILLFALGGAFVFLSGCYPGDALTTSELDIILTSKDEAADFTQYQTFSMPDEVFVYQPENDDFELSPSMEAAILNQVRTNMENLGYEYIEPIDTNPEPDVVVLPEIFILNHSQVGSCWGCWGGWYPWWPGWGGGWYPPYPPTYIVTFQSGTVLLNIIDVDANAGNEDKIMSEWSAAINGLVRNGISESQVTSYINQAFEQSDYLDTNN